MKYSLTFHEASYNELVDHLFASRASERGAYLICGNCVGESEHRLIVREVIPVLDEDVVSSSESHMAIKPCSFLRAMKRAHSHRASFVFVHSHPAGYRRHSPQDDIEEQKLFRTAYNRIRHQVVHGSLVLSDPTQPVGRVWLENGANVPMDVVRVIGSRFRFYPHSEHPSVPNIALFDRQARAFGPDIQPLLKSLIVGVVGAGGTGSAVIEQLTRLGVGKLLIADPQGFDGTNVNRVYGSRVIDEGIQKTKIAQRLVADIGLATEVSLIAQSITKRSAFLLLRDCDVVFSCTDDEWGRSILTRFAVYYHVPVIDMGVKIDSEAGQIRSIHGRVTTLLAGEACLFCRGRIKPLSVAAESAGELRPEEAARLRREGYIPELGDPAPAVVPFTTAVAASAISELLHRLTGFMGPDRRSSEVLHLFDSTRLRTNAVSSSAECFCGDCSRWGRADVTPLLDLTWPEE